MRGLDAVEQNGILQFAGISDDGSLPDDRVSPDESTVTDLRLLIDNAGSRDGSGRRDLRALRDPDAFLRIVEFVRRKGRSEPDIFNPKSQQCQQYADGFLFIP